MTYIQVRVDGFTTLLHLSLHDWVPIYVWCLMCIHTGVASYLSMHETQNIADFMSETL